MNKNLKLSKIFEVKPPSRLKAQQDIYVFDTGDFCKKFLAIKNDAAMKAKLVGRISKNFYERWLVIL
jgi:hypothetical protein